MRYTLLFEEKLNRFTLTTYEELSFEGIQEMMKTLLTHESWKKGRDLLVDHREASFAQITPQEMQYLADAVVTLDQTLGARYCAVVSPDDGVSKHAMYQFDVEDRAELVNRTFLPNEHDKALSWLNSHLSVQQ
ncbi:MAG: hypothetical protein JXX29_05275 [Deltaproteobacteria bacterium]|nr:hypothetical protein [Deltaproteobacteria bacterium]MBN2671059.1 hypothetical protein [Deltaproteobacteria bacterium]